MDVSELIFKLQKMPRNAIVVIDMMSECAALEENEPTLEKMIERNGAYMAFNEKYWDRAKDGEPKLIDVCHFPGN